MSQAPVFYRPNRGRTWDSIYRPDNAMYSGEREAQGLAENWLGLEPKTVNWEDAQQAGVDFYLQGVIAMPGGAVRSVYVATSNDYWAPYGPEPGTLTAGWDGKDALPPLSKKAMLSLFYPRQPGRVRMNCHERIGDALPDLLLLGSDMGGGIQSPASYGAQGLIAEGLVMQTKHDEYTAVERASGYGAAGVPPCMLFKEGAFTFANYARRVNIDHTRKGFARMPYNSGAGVGPGGWDDELDRTGGGAGGSGGVVILSPSIAKDYHARPRHGLSWTYNRDWCNLTMRGKHCSRRGDGKNFMPTWNSVRDGMRAYRPTVFDWNASAEGLLQLAFAIAPVPSNWMGSMTNPEMGLWVWWEYHRKDAAEIANPSLFKAMVPPAARILDVMVNMAPERPLHYPWTQTQAWRGSTKEQRIAMKPAYISTMIRCTELDLVRILGNVSDPLWELESGSDKLEVLYYTLGKLLKAFDGIALSGNLLKGEETGQLPGHEWEDTENYHLNLGFMPFREPAQTQVLVASAFSKW